MTKKDIKWAKEILLNVLTKAEKDGICYDKTISCIAKEHTSEKYLNPEETERRIMGVNEAYVQLTDFFKAILKEG